MAELPAIRLVETSAPLRWLARGWRDFKRIPLVSIGHGLALLAATIVIVAIGRADAALLAGAFSGFVIVAPALCFGLYANSRALERGEVTGPRACSLAWRRAAQPALRAGLLLALTGSVWVLLSSLLVSRAGLQVGGVEGYLRFFAGQGADSPLFWLWLLAGALLAALVFGATAVSLPMLIDRDVSVAEAMRSSIRAVGENPVTMAIWAVIIMVLVMISVVTVVGLVFLVPVLGHASWHAYRELIVAEPDARTATVS